LDISSATLQQPRRHRGVDHPWTVVLIRILAAALGLCDWSEVGATHDDERDALASWSYH